MPEWMDDDDLAYEPSPHRESYKSSDWLERLVERVDGDR